MEEIKEIEKILRSAVEILENVDNTIERYELEKKMVYPKVKKAYGLNGDPKRGKCE